MSILRIAIQKSGRLSEKSLGLISEAGISFNNSDRKLITQATNFPIELLFLRDDDIPQYVADGVADIGIVGENVIFEKKSPIRVVEKLGWAKCRLSIAIPKSENYTGPSYLNGKKIATSYPNILQKFLDENKINCEIHEISGSVEIAPGIGLADGIFDIVSSGSTLISNGLREVEVVVKSEAVIIGDPNLSAEKQEILDKLLFRTRSVQQGKRHKYVVLNAPKENVDKIVNVIPGMKSPTVVTLAQEGWVSVHSVLEESRFWDIIDQLKECGAEGILVMPIEKMIE
ncbi:MAG: ATP phosphoribosyltransferase [Bacteroidota bacterium]|nr:ATP phosphoribosyltransferase [Bacteroidota bacterium]